MDNNFFTAKLTVAFSVFAGLTSFAFYFGQNGIHFLINSSYVYNIWMLLVLLSVFLLIEKKLSKKQVLGLFIFYCCLPFAFYFSEKDFVFVILEQSPKTAILFGCISIILLGKFFKKNEKLIQ